MDKAVEDAEAVRAALKKKDPKTKLFGRDNCHIDDLVTDVEALCNVLGEHAIAILYFAVHGFEYQNDKRLLAKPISSKSNLIKDSLSVRQLIDRLLCEFFIHVCHSFIP